jgi:DNA repair protein RadC
MAYNRKRIFRALSVRSDSGSIDQDRQQFTSGLVVNGDGANVPLADDELSAAALRVLAGRIAGTQALESPRATREYLVVRLAPLEHEVFCCIFLDNRHRVIAFEELFRGTVDGTSVHPREVIKRTLAHNAAAVILAHNHPSGVAEPSQADELITLRLKDGLAQIDVRLLDHLIVGGATIVSLAERGVL